MFTRNFKVRPHCWDHISLYSESKEGWRHLKNFIISLRTFNKSRIRLCITLNKRTNEKGDVVQINAIYHSTLRFSGPSSCPSLFHPLLAQPGSVSPFTLFPLLHSLQVVRVSCSGPSTTRPAPRPYPPSVSLTPGTEGDSWTSDLPGGDSVSDSLVQTLDPVPLTIPGFLTGQP